MAKDRLVYTQKAIVEKSEKPEMERLLKEWQTRLNLNDWEIVAYDECSPIDMKTQGVCGENEWDEVNKGSNIKIVSEKDYGDRLIPFDKEEILVHELLHIKFSLLWNGDNSLQDRVVHQLIEEMAKSLVDAKRSI